MFAHPLAQNALLNIMVSLSGKRSIVNTATYSSSGPCINQQTQPLDNDLNETMEGVEMMISH